MNRPSQATDFVPEFIGQREDEEVVLVRFKHWYMVVAPMARAILIILISFVIPIWLNFANFIFSYGLTTLIYYLWLVFWIGYMIYQYINWYRDRFIITTQRLINVDQRGVLHRQIAEVELDRVQNIPHVIRGVAATRFNFGTVIVQSAGTSDLTLEQVANPALVQEDITRLVKDITAEKPVTAAELIEFIKDHRI